MKKNIFFLVALLAAVNGFSQLSGMAFLSGQNNHAGIKVKFVANSGPSVTDSCLTDAAGNYSINISGGIYKVVYSAAGYQTVFYNNAASVVLTNTTVLNSHTLIPGIAQYVSGFVSGTWSNTVTYYIQADVFIQAANSLTIQPGTKVIFMGNYAFNTQGPLKAIGTAGSRIVFTAADTSSRWMKLNLANSASELSFCIVEHCDLGVTFSFTSPKVSDCIIRNVDLSGISGDNTGADIHHNEIYRYGTHGIALSGSGSSVYCNHIYSGHYRNTFSQNSWGIRVMNGTVVFNNHVHNSTVGIYAEEGQCVIKNNYVHDNTTRGLETGSSLSPGGNMEFTNNVLVNNVAGLEQTGYTNSTKFINNVVVSSTVAVNNGNLTCDHNLFYNCGTNFGSLVSITGIGQVTGTNNNGNAIDSYYNLFQDPLFVAGQAPVVQLVSPLINAGNTSYGNSIGTSDPYAICYSNVPTGIASASAGGSRFRVFPNPGSGLFNLELPEQVQLSVFDAQGHLLVSETVDGGTYHLDLSSRSAGLYLVTLTVQGSTHSLKLIKE